MNSEPKAASKDLGVAPCDFNPDFLSRLEEPGRLKLGKILVPIDFSRCSLEAVLYAIPLAKQFNSAIIVFHVLPIHYAVGADGRISPASQPRLSEVVTQRLAILAAKLAAHHVSVQVETRDGSEAIEIANAAKRYEAELIVISTHGRTGRAHELVGSVAENLVHLAPCPVLVVREGEHAFLENKIAA